MLENDLEVTLLLSVISAAFVIPYERLRPSNEDHVPNDPGLWTVDSRGAGVRDAAGRGRIGESGPDRPFGAMILRHSALANGC